MCVSPTLAAWLRMVLAPLLGLVLVMGGTSGAALADSARCGEHASEAPDQAVAAEDDADPCCAAPSETPDETTASDADDDPCCDDAGSCPPGCDDCGCCPGAVSGLPPALSFVLCELPGSELERPVPRPVHGSRGTTSSIDRPPRAVLG